METPIRKIGDVYDFMRLVMGGCLHSWQLKPRENGVELLRFFVNGKVCLSAFPESEQSPPSYWRYTAKVFST